MCEAVRAQRAENRGQRRHRKEAPEAFVEGGAIALTPTLSLREREHVWFADGAHRNPAAPRRADLEAKGQWGGSSGMSYLTLAAARPSPSTGRGCGRRRVGQTVVGSIGSERGIAASAWRLLAMTEVTGIAAGSVGAWSEWQR
jgi:hypothetical protein